MRKRLQDGGWPMLVVATATLVVAMVSPARAARPGIREFPVRTNGSGPSAIAAGPDGNLWFTEHNGNQIGRITPRGDVRKFRTPTSISGPWDIAAGPDGNLWFTEIDANQIGRITPHGHIREFPLTSDVQPE